MGNLRKIVHLQSLRALSASVVVITHALEYPIRRHVLGEDMYRLAWGIGWTGVASFFAISGLIMIRSGIDGFGSAARARSFALNRIVRIVPLYWLAVMPFALAVLLRHEPLTPGMIARTLLFTPYASPVEPAMRPVVGQGWTLNYEMFFYALFAICLVFPRRIGLTILLSAFPVIVAAGATIRPLTPYRDPGTAIQFWSDPVTLLFVVGMLIGLAERHAPRWHSVRHPMAWTTLVFAITVACFVAGGGHFPMPIEWQAIYALGGAIAVILCTSTAGHAYGRLGRIAEKAGDASFSTYLIHPLVLMVLATGWDRLSRALQSPFVFVLLALPVCNVAGHVCYRTIERPLSRWLRARVLERASTHPGKPCASVEAMDAR